MTFSCRGKVWGVDWIHLVWVGVGIKKARGVVGSGNMHFRYYLSNLGGQGKGLRDWVR